MIVRLAQAELETRLSRFAAVALQLAGSAIRPSIWPARQTGWCCTMRCSGQANGSFLLRGSASVNLIRNPARARRDGSAFWSRAASAGLHAYVGKRLTKAPKVDVLDNLLPCAPGRSQAWFHRTAVGAEMDLVLGLPDGPRRRILIGATDVAPSELADQVQPSVGWPLFEMGLQSGLGQLILRGILRRGRAWCRVLEFAEEFGITTSFEPFRLGERRGGGAEVG